MGHKALDDLTEAAHRAWKNREYSKAAEYFAAVAKAKPDLFTPYFWEVACHFNARNLSLFRRRFAELKRRFAENCYIAELEAFISLKQDSVDRILQTWVALLEKYPRSRKIRRAIKRLRKCDDPIREKRFGRLQDYVSFPPMNYVAVPVGDRTVPVGDRTVPVGDRAAHGDRPAHGQNATPVAVRRLWAMLYPVRTVVLVFFLLMAISAVIRTGQILFEKDAKHVVYFWANKASAILRLFKETTERNTPQLGTAGSKRDAKHKKKEPENRAKAVKEVVLDNRDPLLPTELPVRSPEIMILSQEERDIEKMRLWNSGENARRKALRQKYGPSAEELAHIELSAKEVFDRLRHIRAMMKKGRRNESLIKVNTLLLHRLHIGDEQKARLLKKIAVALPDDAQPWNVDPRRVQWNKAEFDHVTVRWKGRLEQIYNGGDAFYLLVRHIVKKEQGGKYSGARFFFRMREPVGSVLIGSVGEFWGEIRADMYHRDIMGEKDIGLEGHRIRFE